MLERYFRASLLTLTKKINGAFIVLKIALSSCIQMLPFVVLNDVPINGALIVLSNFEIKDYVPTLKSCSLSMNNSEKSSINFKFKGICASLNFINSSRYTFIEEVCEIETL